MQPAAAPAPSWRSCRTQGDADAELLLAQRDRVREHSIDSEQSQEQCGQAKALSTMAWNRSPATESLT